MFIRWSWHVKALKTPIMAALFFPYFFFFRLSLAVWPWTQWNNRYVQQAFSDPPPSPLFVCVCLTCWAWWLLFMRTISSISLSLSLSCLRSSSTIQMGCEKQATSTGPCIIDVRAFFFDWFQSLRYFSTPPIITHFCPSLFHITFFRRFFPLQRCSRTDVLRNL